MDLRTELDTDDIMEAINQATYMLDKRNDLCNDDDDIEEENYYVPEEESEEQPKIIFYKYPDELTPFEKTALYYYPDRYEVQPPYLKEDYKKKKKKKKKHKKNKKKKLKNMSEEDREKQLFKIKEQEAINFAKYISKIEKPMSKKKSKKIRAIEKRVFKMQEDRRYKKIRKKCGDDICDYVDYKLYNLEMQQIGLKKSKKFDVNRPYDVNSVYSVGGVSTEKFTKSFFKSMEEEMMAKLSEPTIFDIGEDSPVIETYDEKGNLKFKKADKNIKKKIKKKRKKERKKLEKMIDPMYYNMW